MRRKSIRLLGPAVETRFLPFVRRPGRYIGGEVNQVRKDLDACDVRIALCFPDVYEIGMSHTGLAILYHVLNGLPGVAAERVFCPWIDAEAVLRRESIPLFTLESTAAVADFDIVGFGLTNELCYTNLLNALDLAGLPIRAADRGPDHPLILAGGQAANACEPIAPFVDLFVLGEGEQAVVQLMEQVRSARAAGYTKQQMVRAAAEALDFVYAPSLYEFKYAGDRIISFDPMEPGLRTRFENAVVEDLEAAPVPDRPIVPHVEPVHDRISIEVMRGCPGRCRFCQASYCRRPVRFRSVN
ncbi:MAG TPA: B12-binding domain-containing radical SAM protein, partial [Phycisphaerales bacterium]|nr:B12-binding domain-containing radical SAM protein [Phycisphaerales bacterium]